MLVYSFCFGLSKSHCNIIPFLLESVRYLPEMLDKTYFPWYNIAILANIANWEVNMTTKTIPSTEAQNNFGRILDDVIQNNTRYVIKRRNISQAILLNLPDFERLLAASENERKQMGNVIRELSPVYNLGETVD